MPLRDHFRGPLAGQRSWEELHGAWPGVMAFRLNSFLPPEYRSGVRVRLGTAIENDGTAFEFDEPLSVTSGDGRASVATALAPAALLLDIEEPTPPECRSPRL